MFNRQWDFYGAGLSKDPMMSFAIDDMLQVKISDDGVGKLRAWIHDKYVILGLHDARLPYLDAGLEYLRSEGFEYIVRNSGGLGVVLDDGILNLSIIVERDKVLDIDDGYEMMFHLVKESFPESNVEAYEIERSYCPGSYDLSIGGKKFAGISQRRIRGGVAVQIYLSVEGAGSSRAELMREFYARAKNNAETKFHYPDVDPNQMASLSELLGVEIDVDEVLGRLLATIEAQGGILSEITAFDGSDVKEIEHQYKRMMDRNKDIV
ncbi:MAG TPA: lipoate--protein ligase family protein [Aliicoccus persicus]|uniref:Octanoyl-[GcvH]:protein N-octanoyltransferase n=1 Tax=Aliicoccus persicus TaxID=930138 RepID=A0A921B6I6_9STAP|nr:lipoate--protein ligase family protein [Aliicoccus persicus]